MTVPGEYTGSTIMPDKSWQNFTVDNINTTLADKQACDLKTQ